MLKRWHKLHRKVSSVFKNRANPSGLIMIQIDGLSMEQFESALNSGKLPFIKQLLNHSNYLLHSFYSGLPSSTPAVQAELFYGVKGAVPAFGFFCRSSGIIGNMLSSQFARTVQSRIEKRGYNLLKGGSAYSDILTGGARKALFCATSLGFEVICGKRRIVGLLKIVLRPFLLLRVLSLLLLEFFLAVMDFFRGLLQHQRFINEIIFIPSRVAICILLRELIVLGVCHDIVEGYPIIHCNFLGYDEQSHRRGPKSVFAHWTLKGIDGAIRRIICSSRRGNCRHYKFLIYSDHGQEEVKSYADEFGVSLKEALTNVLDKKISVDQKDSDIGIQKRRALLLGVRQFRNFDVVEPQRRKGHIIISSVGPLAHLYFEGPLNEKCKRNIAETLVNRAHIPSVLFSDHNSDVYVMTKENCWRLKENASEFLGRDHPFSCEITQDLIDLVHHPDAGDLICCGWRKLAKPLSFPQENGAHAGPGPQETHGFVIIPADFLGKDSKEIYYVRPLWLRKAVMKFLNG